MQHSILGASKASRWINCTPSARLEEAIEGLTEAEESEFAAQGTEAHALAERWLRNLNGQDIPIDWKAYDDETIEAVEVYVDFIKPLLTPTAELIIEQRVDFSQVVPDGFGTSDAVIIDGDTLHVVDYKHGAGVRVTAHDNPQLRLYAFGSLLTRPAWSIKTVVMTIIQPRVGNTSTHVMPTWGLTEWAASIADRAELAHRGEGQLSVGHWCQFCKARTRCKANGTLVNDFARKSKYLLDDDKLAELYLQFENVQSWMDKVSADLLERANKGAQLKGLKLVEGRATRRWADEQSVAKTLTKMGWKPDSIYTQKLQGLTAIEKLVGKPDFKAKLEPFVIKPQGAPKLVPMDDKRPPIAQSAVTDFQEPI